MTPETLGWYSIECILFSGSEGRRGLWSGNVCGFEYCSRIWRLRRDLKYRKAIPPETASRATIPAAITPTKMPIFDVRVCAAELVTEALVIVVEVEVEVEVVVLIISKVRVRSRTPYVNWLISYLKAIVASLRATLQKTGQGEKSK
jgi:hypothetical protein